VIAISTMNRKYLGVITALVLLGVLASLTILLIAGWGVRLHPVAGRLVWEDGQPAKELVGCMIYFESPEQRSISRSTVHDDGSFQLTTEAPEARGTDGAPPGHHRVYLVDGRPPLIESRFRRPDTSGLEVIVPSDGPVVLKVERIRKQPSTPSFTPDTAKLKATDRLKNRNKN